MKVDLKASTKRESAFMLGTGSQSSRLTPTACESRRRARELSVVFVEIVRSIKKYFNGLMGHIEMDDGCSYIL